MLTNRIHVTYNMEKIDADFDIYKVEKAKKDYYRCNILDSALYVFQAAAVQWSFGATALVLFRKGEVTERQFRESIMREYEDVKIQKVDVLNREQCDRCFYYEYRLLAQLLLNSMHTPKHARLKYHNLTGKLLYRIHGKTLSHKVKSSEEENFLRFLEIVISPGMYLNLEHITFRKYEGGGAGLYVVDQKTGEFRKKLKTDGNLTTYKEGSLPHKRFTVDNFDISGIEKFRESKLGVMEQFLRDVKTGLSEYMTIELTEREDMQEYAISKLEKKGITEHEYGQMLQKRGVVIVDENCTEESEYIAEKLQEELERYYDTEAVVGALSEDAYNIRIIHDADYYAEKEMQDPHDDDLKGYIVQHIVEEAEHFKREAGFTKAAEYYSRETDTSQEENRRKKKEHSSPDVKKIVQELVIKGDVRDRQISIFDWERLDSGKEWTFVLRNKFQGKAGENAEHVNHAGNKTHHFYRYDRLKTDRHGNMEFDTYCDDSPDETEEWSKICFAYDFVQDRFWGAQNRVEGLLYSDIDNIHAILLTCEKTLPNTAALMDTLIQTDEKEKVPKKHLLEAIDDFESENIVSDDCILKWKQELSAETEMITKKRLKKIFNMRSGSGRAFNRFLHEKYGVWIYGEMRNGEFEAAYQIENLLNIKYEYGENFNWDGRTLVYCVGDKSKKTSYPNACCMRMVVSMGDELEYEEVLPLLAVDFVRNSQYTVRPFPYKYLREYIAQS